MTYGTHRSRGGWSRPSRDFARSSPRRASPGQHPSRRLSRDDEWIIRWLVLTMIIVSLPSKFLYLAGPPLFAVAMLWRGVLISPSRFVALTTSLLGLSTVSLLVDYYQGEAVSFFGMFFWFLTHMPWLIAFSASRELRVSSQLLDRLVGFLSWFVIIQSLVSGISIFLILKQGGFEADSGDFISGTFGILDWFGEPTISHVFFTLCMFSLFVALWPFRHRGLVAFALLAGTPVTILAQSGHQVFFFMVAILVATVAGHRAAMRAVWAGLGAAIVGAILLGILVVAYPFTIENTGKWFDKVVNAENSPKRIVLEGVFAQIMTLKVLFLGTGLGQFSSRAALFACGWYAPGKVPDFLVSVTDRTRDHLFPALVQHELTGEGSAISQPMFSLMTLPVEWGLPLVFVFLGAVFLAVGRAIAHARSDDAERSAYGRYVTFFAIFLGLSCTIENYIEFTQGLFLPVVVAVLVMARAKGLSRLST